MKRCMKNCFICVEGCCCVLVYVGVYVVVYVVVYVIILFVFIKRIDWCIYFEFQL